MKEYTILYSGTKTPQINLIQVDIHFSPNDTGTDVVKKFSNF